MCARQSLIQAVQENFPVRWSEGVQPAFYRLVQLSAALRHLIYHHKAAALYLPGVGVMLENAQLAALDDGVGVLMLQQHPHHRGLGNKGVDTGDELQIAGCGEQTQTMLEEDKLSLEAKIAVQNETLETLQKDREDLAKQEADILKKIGDLEKDQAAAQKEYYENKKKEDQLDKELEEYLAELQRKNQEKMESGDWLWPISLNDYHYNSSGYGWRLLYGVWDYHRGWDLAAYRGTPILASKGGKVVIAQYHNSYGNYIVIDHGDGVSTVYAHCSKLNVAKGDTVKKGDKIGEVGTTGNSTGNHLHFEFRLNGKYIDPFTYIKNPPIKIIASRYQK